MESLEMLQTINFAQNLLGASHDNSEPPIYAFTECLNKNKYLLDVNFSYNLINQEAIFLIAQILKSNTSIKKINFDGNPIGKEGVGYILSVTQENKTTSIEEIGLNDTQNSDDLE